MDDLEELLNQRIERAKKIDELSQRLLIMGRNTLTVNLRFMDMALSKLEYVPTPEDKFDTDGKFLYYDPEYLLKRYKEGYADHETGVITHDILHATMHCVFRHMFVHTLVDRACWDLACDIAVEYTIYGLNLNSTRILRETMMQHYFKEFDKSGIMITAEKLYRYFLDAKLPAQKMAELHGVFCSDTHDVWYMTLEEKAQKFGMGIRTMPGHGEDRPDESDAVNTSNMNMQNGDAQDGSSMGTESENGASAEDASSIFSSFMGRNIEDEWKNVSESMQMDMETFSNGRGGVSQGLIQNLKEVNREKYDYTSFLKKFAVMGEAMKLNDDEFDYIYYTYGMKLYGKVPLIEPLEYKDVKSIKEFVIAIDTSGSVVGDLVQLFVQKTYNVLKSTESFFNKINLHIIQCDDQIQEDVKITSQEDFDEYFSHMKLKGFGGNNEVKLFSYVDELIRNKEFTNLKGMIYFTDGYGIFPTQKPDYEVAFAFIENARWPIPEDIPPWVIKLVLEKEDLESDK